MAPTEAVLKKPSETLDPGAAAVGRLPDAAADAAEVVDVGLRGHARDRDDAAAAERSDQAEAQVSGRRLGGEEEREDQENRESQGFHREAIVPDWLWNLKYLGLF